MKSPRASFAGFCLCLAIGLALLTALFEWSGSRIMATYRPSAAVEFVEEGRP